MTYNVVVEHGKNRAYRATVLGWPNFSVSGRSREEALAKMRRNLQKKLAQVEIVPMEIEAAREENPWLKHAGAFRDDPLFDEMLEEVAAYRREIDEDPGAA